VLQFYSVNTMLLYSVLFSWYFVYAVNTDLGNSRNRMQTIKIRMDAELCRNEQELVAFFSTVPCKIGECRPYA
jgi:hypothetical protein